MKIFVSALLVGVLVLSAVGCGGGTSTPVVTCLGQCSFCSFDAECCNFSCLFFSDGIFRCGFLGDLCF